MADFSNAGAVDAPCDHDLAQCETACADGMCPICLAAALVAAQERIGELEEKHAKIVNNINASHRKIISKQRTDHLAVQARLRLEMQEQLSDYVKVIAQWERDFGEAHRKRESAEAALRQAVAAETERCMRLLNMTRDDAQLMAGEMTAQEWRTVSAILVNRITAIRAAPSAQDEKGQK